MTTELSFTTKLKELDVNIDERLYKLRELTGDKRSDYVEKSMSRAEFKGSKLERMKDIKGIEMDILECTLYDPEGNLVSVDVLRQWPFSVLEKLAAASLALSGLDNPGKESKND